MTTYFGHNTLRNQAEAKLKIFSYFHGFKLQEFPLQSVRKEVITYYQLHELHYQPVRKYIYSQIVEWVVLG